MIAGLSHYKEVMEFTGATIQLGRVVEQEVMMEEQREPLCQNICNDAIFVIAPQTAERVLERVGETKPEYEKAAGYGQVNFWSAPLDTFSHTR